MTLPRTVFRHPFERRSTGFFAESKKETFSDRCRGLSEKAFCEIGASRQGGWGRVGILFLRGLRGRCRLTQKLEWTIVAEMIQER